MKDYILGRSLINAQYVTVGLPPRRVCDSMRVVFTKLWGARDAQPAGSKAKKRKGPLHYSTVVGAFNK